MLGIFRYAGPIQPGVVNQTRPIYPNLHNAGYNPNYNNGNMDIGHFSNVNPSPSCGSLLLLTYS